MSRLKRHLARPITRKFKNESGETDVFSFYPLPVKYLPEYMDISGKIYKAINKDGKEEKDEKKMIERVLSFLDKENTDILLKLIKAMIDKSFPDETNEVKDEFISSHFNELVNILFEVNANEPEEKNRKPKKSTFG